MTIRTVDTSPPQESPRDRHNAAGRGGTPLRARRRPRSARRGEIIAAMLMLAPAVIGLIFLRALPTVTAVIEGFQRTSLSTGQTSWVGFDNYLYLFGNPSFHEVVGVTLLFNIIVNPVVVVASLAVAVLLAEALPGAGVWRSLVFLPAAVPAAVTALIWGTALQGDGLVNALLGVFGIGPQPFLTSPGQALFAIGIMVVWGSVGYWMIFVIAGLKDVPETLYEAAKIDGAGWWNRFLRITLPLLKRPLAFVLVASTVGNFLVFAPVQILTKGGPEGSTNLVMFDVFNNAFVKNDMGLAQAEVVLLLLVLGGIVAAQFRLLRTDF